MTLEIGSNTGEQIVAAAAAHPERDFLAPTEVWVRVSRSSSQGGRRGSWRIRVIEAGAAQSVFHHAGDACLDGSGRSSPIRGARPAS